MAYVHSYEDFINERRPNNHPLIQKLMSELTQPSHVPDPADRLRENIFSREIDKKRLAVDFVADDKRPDTGEFEVRDENNKILYKGIEIPEIVKLISKHIPHKMSI
jgi:hypothetical protein